MEKKIIGGKKRTVCFVAILALLFTVMQIAGWQISMKYGTSVHTSEFFQRIGVLEPWQCAVCGIVEFTAWFLTLYRLFSYSEKKTFAELTGNSGDREQAKPDAKGNTCAAHRSEQRVWLGIGLGLYAIYLVWLIALYPGFYNYDMGNQLPQIMYAEVPFSAFHPLLHTIIGGGIITIGYHLFYSVDLTFGIFLYNVVQMGLCAGVFTYAMQFLYRRTGRKVLLVFAFAFYAFCPSIVLFAMSTTKDVSCFAFMLLAVLKGFCLLEKLEKQERITWHEPVSFGVLIIVVCMLRNNMIYGVVVFAVIALVFCKAYRKWQICLYAGMIIGYFLCSHALTAVCDAEGQHIEEALSVPFQQIARLYQDYGEAAFTEEELELLYAAIEPETLGYYDPMISDEIKYGFYQHRAVLWSNTGAYVKLWLKKGLQYPGTYLVSILDNTYQAWYPGTVLREKDGTHRYIHWPTDDYVYQPKCEAFAEALETIATEDSYARIPVLRLFFVTGTMLWITLAAWLYGWYRRDRKVLMVLGLVLAVTATNFAGPVSDIRYYLILFYLAPVCVGFFLGRGRNASRT